MSTSHETEISNFKFRMAHNQVCKFRLHRIVWCYSIMRGEKKGERVHQLLGSSWVVLTCWLGVIAGIKFNNPIVGVLRGNTNCFVCPETVTWTQLPNDVSPEVFRAHFVQETNILADRMCVLPTIYLTAARRFT